MAKAKATAKRKPKAKAKVPAKARPKPAPARSASNRSASAKPAPAKAKAPAKVQAVPPGHERIIAHLVMKNSAAAIAFYEKAFGAKEIARMPGPGGGIMHAEVQIGPSILYMADEFPGMSRSPQTLGGTPVTLTLYCENPDAVYNRAVAAGAKPTMPLQNMFWGDRYGKFTNPAGHDWAIVAHLEDLSWEEMARRSEEAMKNFQPPSPSGGSAAAGSPPAGSPPAGSPQSDAPPAPPQ